MTISNNKISNLINSQVPFFVRNDHQNFVTFLEKYYEYVEQNDKVVNKIKNVQTYRDIDLTETQFAERLYDTFMKYIPKNILADKTLIIKHIKDFYRAKGTEKATRFLMRILYDEEIEFYYPKKDILRVSDGKWFVQKSLKVRDVQIANVPSPNILDLEKYVGTQITGVTSNATAIVDRTDRYYDRGTVIDELFLTNITGSFQDGEKIWTFINGDESIEYASANIYSGIINSIVLQNGGFGYTVGYSIPIESNSGTGAAAIISSVSTGSIASITVLSGGAGYRVNDQLLFSGGGTGSGANANVFTVLNDSSVHPNSYNIISSVISLEANTAINNTVYSNLNSSNVNTTIANAMSYWTYANTGPASSIFIISEGQNYSEEPSLSIIANSEIQQLGILGRMEIIDGGQNYKIGDLIEFINVPGGYGVGATANVVNVNMGNSNSISQVKFQQMSGQFVGGSGYSQALLPRANVVSATGNGANIIVSAILGSGGTLKAANSSIGTIKTITLLSGGSGYKTVPTINLKQSGDGTAIANATIVTGVYTYPGRYLNDDGHISSYNFLEDRDYYQIFSYVVKSTKSINTYRDSLNNLTHPAGMKLFGEVDLFNENENLSGPDNADDSVKIVLNTKTYTKTGNTINISYISHGYSVNSNVYIEYTSGGINSNVFNGIYMISNSATNYFEVTQNVANTLNTSGNLVVGAITA